MKELQTLRKHAEGVAFPQSPFGLDHIPSKARFDVAVNIAKGGGRHGWVVCKRIERDAKSFFQILPMNFTNCGWTLLLRPTKFVYDDMEQMNQPPRRQMKWSSLRNANEPTKQTYQRRKSTHATHAEMYDEKETRTWPAPCPHGLKQRMKGLANHLR